MKKIKVALLFCATCLLFASCAKDAMKNKPADPAVNTAQTSANYDETAKNVAKDVANKLNSLAFRKMLRHEVLLRFDGDANILISSMMKRLPKYLEYERNAQNLNRTAEENDLLNSFSFDVLQQAGNTFPQMQIAVQTDAETWNATTFIPKVVYLPAAFDEATHNTISGYDNNQNPISVSSLIDPTDNFVVISFNERTILRPNDAIRLRTSECIVDDLLGAAPYNPDGNPTPIVPCNIGGGTGSGGGSGTGSGGTGSNPFASYSQYVGTGPDVVMPTLVDLITGTEVAAPPAGTFNRLTSVGTFSGTTIYRTNYRHEKMRFIRCDDLSSIESWANGAPEIRMHIFEQSVINPIVNLQIYKAQFEPRKRKQIMGQWWPAQNVTMHLWDYTGTGTKATAAYYEYDPVLIPNETLAQIGAIRVDLLAITGSIPTGTPSELLIYGNIRQSVLTGLRALKQRNGMSEYIGKDDYIIFNDEDQFNHNPGETKFKTDPDL